MEKVSDWLNIFEAAIYALVGLVFFITWSGKYIVMMILSAVIFMIGLYILLFRAKRIYKGITKHIPAESNVPYGIVITLIGLTGLIWSIIKIDPF
ncbi:MAG: hypothetical protein JXA06_13630 [Bacteroidetes bacterium]|nr:hypothetical protein [Bacteroidota bacterium]